MALARRSFLFTLAAACSAQNTGKGRVFPSTAARYADPATEFPILRLTDPQASSRLPNVGNRIVTTRGFLYASGLSGTLQAFWMDLKNRTPRQLTECAMLDGDSLALSPDAHLFWHFDGPQLIETNLGSLRKTREPYRVPEGFRKTPGVAFNDVGTHAAFVEKGEMHRLRLIDLSRSAATTLIESPEEIIDPLFRPHHNSLLYRSQGQIFTIDFDGTQHAALLASANVPHMQWTTDGAALLYLNRPADPAKLTTLEQYTPETGASTRIASTSQFVTFQTNTNGSVIAGVSGSKASPYLLLLIRSARRELTLAEHHASDPQTVAPQFSPNSQFLIFGSDRHGKPAIYWMPVDKLVTETDGS